MACWEQRRPHKLHSGCATEMHTKPIEMVQWYEFINRVTIPGILLGSSIDARQIQLHLGLGQDETPMARYEIIPGSPRSLSRTCMLQIITGTHSRRL